MLILSALEKEMSDVVASKTDASQKLDAALEESRRLRVSFRECS